MDQPETPLEKAIRLAGGQVRLAEKIGKQQQHVSYWLKAKNGVPAEYAKAIEDAVEGQVRRDELRPDIFGPAPVTGDAA